jgi:hypothetical protein
MSKGIKSFSKKQENSTKTRRKLPMGAKAAIAIGAMSVATVFGACDNGTTTPPPPQPKVCECPPGTLHEPGEKCCDGEDCACGEKVPPIVCECPPGTTHKPGEKCCDGEDCACTEEVPPIVCECPPGTLHKPGEKCCDGEDCACEEEKPKCECPAGTFHNEGEACCEGEDCECKEAYNVFLGDKKIRVEDITGLANRTEIQDALTSLDTSSSSDYSIIHFKGMNTSPVMVIENTHNFRVEGSKFFIGIDKISQRGIDDTVYDAIWDIYYGDGEETPGTPLMSRASNKEINIRLANGRTLNVASAKVPGTKFLDKFLS